MNLLECEIRISGIFPLDFVRQKNKNLQTFLIWELH